MGRGSAPARSDRRPFREVEVIDDAAESSTVLWRTNAPLRVRGRRPASSGACYLVVGEGDALYRGSRLGPLFTLERVLCPRAREREFPEHWLAVAGDVLADSLRRLPGHVPAHSVQFPQAPEAAATLAAGAATLFPPGELSRPAGAVGELVFPLAQEFRLQVEQRADDSVWLCLRRGASEVPVVEWRAGPRTSLHLVRPDGGGEGRPRYFLRGIDLTREVAELMALPRTQLTEHHARGVLRALGMRGGQSQPVTVSRRQ